MKFTFDRQKKSQRELPVLQNLRTVLNFTDSHKEQERFEKVMGDDLYQRLPTLSGVAMCFKTYSETLTLNINASLVKCRPYFLFDVFVNGKYYDCRKNFDKPDYITVTYGTNGRR